MDIFVLPSLTEGLPMALLESMAAGKPIVATSVGEVPQVLQYGKAGVLIPPGSPETLCEALLSLLTHEDKARDLARAASREVETNYSSDTMVEQYLSIYKQLLN